MELPSQIAQIGTMAERLLSAWTQDSRLHTLATPPGAAAATDASAGSAAYAIPRVRASDLLLERFELHEAVSEPFCLSLQVLMLDAHVPLKQLCGLALTLRTQLADGSHVLRSGIVTEARALHADGGFARKALTVQPWIALLAHTLNSRVWQDRSVIDIVDDVFSRHPELAVWRWDEGVADHVAQGCSPATAASAPTACSTAKATSISCSACWPKRALRGGWKRSPMPAPMPMPTPRQAMASSSSCTARPSRRT